MAESYCMKSCTECAREGCPGCRAGAFAQQCEIVRCCREKMHESCGTCSGGIYCPTRNIRNRMPEEAISIQRREAEQAERARRNAQGMCKWVSLIFWSMIASIAVSLLGFAEDLVAAMRWVDLVGSMVTTVMVFAGYYFLQEVDDRFGTVAWLWLMSGWITALMSAFAPEESALTTVVDLVMFVPAVILVKMKSETFRDVLTNMSLELSEKWEKQWKLYKISLLLSVCGIVILLIPVIGLVGFLGVLGGLGLLLFVTIREYVLLWETAQVCEVFAER